MGSMPKKMVAGLALGLFGGVVALVLMANAWDGSLDSIYKVGMCMLVSCMFFAVAGTFTKYSPVQGSTMTVLSAIAVISTVAALLLEALSLWMALLLIVVGVVAMLCAACPVTSHWVDVNRRL